MRRFWAVLAILPFAAGAEKPRIFITESGAMQASGEAALGDTRGTLYLTGGTSPQNIEVMKAFQQRCRDVAITGNRDKADYIVRLDSEGLSPVTPFVRANKVAVFDTSDDLVHSDSTRLLGNAVKSACSAILAHARQNTKSAAGK